MERRRTVLLIILFAVVLPFAMWSFRKAHPEYAMPTLQASKFPPKEEMFARAEKLAPNDPGLPPLLQQLTYSSRSKEDFQRLIPIAGAALESTENKGMRARMEIALGCAYAGIGDVERARVSFEHVVQDLPAGPSFEEAKSRLYDLEYLRVGLPAPEFSEAGVDAKPVRLSDFRGKVVLLDFWATWCAPCVAQLPDVKRLQEKFSSRGLVVLWISLDNDRAKFEKLLARERLAWPVIYGGQGFDSTVAKLYDIHGIPTYYLLDHQGRIAARNVAKDSLEEEVVKLLEK